MDENACLSFWESGPLISRVFSCLARIRKGRANLQTGRDNATKGSQRQRSGNTGSDGRC